MGVTAMINMLSKNVTGRPASKKSYRTSTIMDEGHETEKLEGEKVNYVRCFFSLCAPGWGQPMTCMETMIDKTAIGMHIGYTTTVHHRMRYQEQYPIVRATSPEAPSDLPDALSDHPEALGDIAVAPGDILRPQVTSLRPHETSLRP